MTSRLKSTQEPSVILEYVDWPSALAAYPAPEKAAQRLTTPEQLQEYMYQALTDPGAYVSSQFNARLERLPADQTQALRDKMKQLAARLGELHSRIRDRIGRTSYQVTDIKTQGDSATATILATTEGAPAPHPDAVAMKRIDGKWFLPSVDYAKSEGGRL